MAGAMSGLRVLETGEGVACAVTGMLMADFGADVIRLESTTQRHPNPGFVMWHRNKRPRAYASARQPRPLPIVVKTCVNGFTTYRESCFGLAIVILLGNVLRYTRGA